MQVHVECIIRSQPESSILIVGLIIAVLFESMRHEHTSRRNRFTKKNIPHILIHYTK